MRALDFFCGAGGFTAGLRRSGIEVLAGIDANESCRDTYTLNNPGSQFICADIRSLDARALKAALPEVRANDDDLVFVGCAPCQPFSQQRRATKPHPDGTLLGRFGLLVDEYRPGYVVVENVPGIAAVTGNSSFNRFVRMLERANYSVECEVRDAKQYGVPQSRRRLVLIASRVCEASLPTPTHGPGLLPWRTVKDTIAKYPRLAAGATSANTPNHQASALSPLNAKRMRNTPKDGGSRASWPDSLVLDCHKNGHRGHSDVYGRMRWDHPAPTLTGRCHSISNGRFGHPEQNRALSLREAAALQTFSDDYKFYGSMRGIALQVGNAVPVDLAHVLGKHLLSMTQVEEG
ncbi:MAG: DNA cytosine methyltransferase [Coriobacteriia bacterium]|nr:DNA cytosine methyltransferase [Coriobacteriia bacterium]